MKWMLAALTLIAASAQAEPTVSFAQAIAPVLKARCALCHMTGEEAGHMALHPDAAYASLVGVQASEVPALMRVKPGAPDRSYMLMKIEGTHLKNGGMGARMPFGGPPLDKATIEMIRAWIAAGAPEN